jgi:TolB-like protein
MITRFAAFISVLALQGTILAKAPRAIAFGPIVSAEGSAQGNELELRFPLLTSKALKVTGKAGRILFPNQVADILKKSELKPQARYTLKEYAKIRGELGGANLVTGEILPADTGARTRLHYFDFEKNTLTSLEVRADPGEIAPAMVRQFLQLEDNRIMLTAIPLRAKIILCTSLEAKFHNELIAELLHKGYQVVLSQDENSFSENEILRMKYFESSAVSYVSPEREAHEANVKLILSPASDEDEEKYVYEQSSRQFDAYYTNFPETLSKTAIDLGTKTNADYLLVVYADGRNSFARALDLKNGGIIWKQDAFPEAKSSDTVDVVVEIVRQMQQVPLNVATENLRIDLSQGKQSAKGQGGGLASVAILDFYDKTNTQLYSYLSSSLSQAVDGSMQRIFEFDRANVDKSNQAGRAHLKASGDADKKALAAFQQQTGADYLIYGDYTFNTKTGKVSIRARIYDLARKTVIGTTVMESNVDGTLFTAVDQIADKIVQDILLMAQSQ